MNHIIKALTLGTTVLALAGLGLATAPPASADEATPMVTLDYSKACGSITLTTVNNDAVNPGWYYGLKGMVGSERVVSAVQKGPGTKVTTKTFAEDYNGGSVTVDVSVYAATEQDLLPAAWPNLTTVVSVVVDTDCLPLHRR